MLSTVMTYTNHRGCDAIGKPQSLSRNIDDNRGIPGFNAFFTRTHIRKTDAFHFRDHIAIICPAKRHVNRSVATCRYLSQGSDMSNLSFSVGVRLDHDVHQRLIRLAAADGRKLSQYIARLCADHVGVRQAGTDDSSAVTVRNPAASLARDPAPPIAAGPNPEPDLPQPVTDWMNPKPRPRRKR